LTSGFPQPTSGKEAAEGDALPFLKKPYSKQQLQEAVETLFHAEVS